MQYTFVQQTHPRSINSEIVSKALVRCLVGLDRGCSHLPNFYARNRLLIKRKPGRLFITVFIGKTSNLPCFSIISIH